MQVNVTESNAHCPEDSLELNEQNHKLGTLCGMRSNENPIAFYSSFQEITVIFTSDSEQNANGIKVNVTFFSK